LHIRFLAFVLGLSSLLLPLSAATLPRQSPEYAIKLTSGKQVLLSSHRGKVVALMFVMTTCPHCQTTCQFMEKLQKEYGPRNFQPLAVAFNEMSIMLVPDFIKSSGATFPIGYDNREPVFNYLQRSTSLQTYVPIMVLIDRKGMIRAQYMGDDVLYSDPEKNIRAAVDKLLKEPVAKKGK
jgi:peroxiredoxin